MKATSTADLVKVFLLGMITALLAVIALKPGGGEAQAAAGGIGGPVMGNGIMALTAPEEGVLYLVDPVNKYIAQYDLSNSRFSLRSARYFENDLRIKEASDKGGMSVNEAEREAEKSMKKR